MRPRKLGRRSPCGDVAALGTTPWPRFRLLTYQRLDQPVGLGSGVERFACSADQSSGSPKPDTSPFASAAAWASSDQKLPYLTPRSSPPPPPGSCGVTGSALATVGSCWTVRKAPL